MKKLNFAAAVFLLAAMPLWTAEESDEEAEIKETAPAPAADAATLEKEYETWKKFGVSNKTLLFQAAEDGDTAMVSYLIKVKKIDVHTRDEDNCTALMVAARAGKTDVVNLLAELGADVNARDRSGKSALMYAAENNTRSNTVKALGKLKADASYRDETGDGALSLAARGGQTAVLEALIKAGCPVNEAFVDGKTAVMIAANNKHYQTIRSLVNLKGKLNAKDANGDTALNQVLQAEMKDGGKMDIVSFLVWQGASPNIRNRSGRDALMLAAMMTNADQIVTFLLENGADLKNKDEGNRTAEELARTNDRDRNADLIKNFREGKSKKKTASDKLLIAARRGKTKLVAELLKQGGNVSARGVQGYTPLMMAAISGKSDALKLLIQAGANVNDKNMFGYSVLTLAAAQGSVSAVKALLERGANVLAVTDTEGYTALMAAVRANRPAMIAPLVAANADINAVDTKGVPVLIHAVQGKSPESVRILLERGVNPSVKSTEGHTALITAMLEKIPLQYKIEIVSILLNKGANANDADRFNGSAMIHAIQANSPALVRLLCKHGANVNVSDRFGNTALMRSVSNPEIVRILLRYGADVTQRNSKGRTAYDAAKSGGHTETAELLFKLSDGKAAAENPAAANLSPREKELREAFARVSGILNAELMDDPAIDRQRLQEKYMICTKLMKDFEDLKDTKAWKKIEAFRKKQMEKLKNLPKN